MTTDMAFRESNFLKTWEICSLKVGGFVIWRDLEKIKHLLDKGWSSKFENLNQITSKVLDRFGNPIYKDGFFVDSGNVEVFVSYDHAEFNLEYIRGV